MPENQLEAGEHIIKIIRKHPINVFPVIFATVVVILATIYGAGWLTVHQAEVSKYVPAPTVTLALLVIDGLMIVVSLLALQIFRQNRIILTNKHLVQVTQNGLFDRTLSKFTLDELQDVKGSRTGVLATVLNYGDLLIETAGAKDNFEFGPVPDPLNNAETINDSHENFEKEHMYIRQ